MTHTRWKEAWLIAALAYVAIEVLAVLGGLGFLPNKGMPLGVLMSSAGLSLWLGSIIELQLDIGIPPSIDSSKPLEAALMRGVGYFVPPFIGWLGLFTHGFLPVSILLFAYIIMRIVRLAIRLARLR